MIVTFGPAALEKVPPSENKLTVALPRSVVVKIPQAKISVQLMRATTCLPNLSHHAEVAPGRSGFQCLKRIWWSYDSGLLVQRLSVTRLSG